MGPRQLAANAPSITTTTTSSEDECVQKLALLVEHQDSRKLHEIVELIARLTGPVAFAAN